MTVKTGSGWARGDPFRAAGGRRHYNRLRQLAREERWRRILELVAGEGGSLLDRGRQADLARRLGVSPATVSRDVAGIFATPSGPERCPLCRRWTVKPEGWDEMRQWAIEELRARAEPLGVDLPVER